MQGGECALPIPRFPTGVMRGRFHPGNGQLYTCGLYGWAGDQTQPGGLLPGAGDGQAHVPAHRPERTGARHGADDSRTRSTRQARPIRALHGQGLVDQADRQLWLRALQRASAADQARRAFPRTAAPLFLEIPELQPTMCMEITYRIQGRGGEPVTGVIHNTIHHLAPGLFQDGRTWSYHTETLILSRNGASIPNGLACSGSQPAGT